MELVGPRRLSSLLIIFLPFISVFQMRLGRKELKHGFDKREGIFFMIKYFFSLNNKISANEKPTANFTFVRISFGRVQEN